MSIAELSKLKRMALRGLLSNPNFDKRKVATLSGHIGESDVVTKELLNKIGASVNARGFASLS